MELKEIRNLNDFDISQKAVSLRKDLFDMRQERRMGKLEKPARFKVTRKEIAQVLTVINERKIQNGKKTQ